MAKHPTNDDRASAEAPPKPASPGPPWLTGLLSAARTHQEAGRLDLQGEVYGPITRRFFIEAGIRDGMRVLDVGSGTGAVSELASELVGPRGSVVGVEHGATMVEIAAERLRSAARANVTFVQGDIESADLDGPFDAVVGRFVLRELKDAAGSLRALSRLLVPGGIVAFQEKVLVIPVTTSPPLPIVEKVRGWLDEARRRAGVELAMGTRLPRVYADAGLPAPELRLDAPVGAAPDWAGYDYLVEMLRGMLPLVFLYGIASADEIGIDDLAARMRAEAASTGGVAVLTPCIGAWAARGAA
ncbi:class I SAM-dependent methyltransferase [Sorangium sp. So ce1000]|uniref:class I SAM-dependent methyltransferase n=1 Tax=Sorangium sp. So ce1000 TaxID=3133325 RepID=UPI003F638520